MYYFFKQRCNSIYYSPPVFKNNSLLSVCLLLLFSYVPLSSTIFTLLVGYPSYDHSFRLPASCLYSLATMFLQLGSFFVLPKLIVLFWPLVFSKHHTFSRLNKRLIFRKRPIQNCENLEKLVQIDADQLTNLNLISVINIVNCIIFAGVNILQTDVIIHCFPMHC